MNCVSKIVDLFVGVLVRAGESVPQMKESLAPQPADAEGEIYTALGSALAWTISGMHCLVC